VSVRLRHPGGQLSASPRVASSGPKSTATSRLSGSSPPAVIKSGFYNECEGGLPRARLNKRRDFTALATAISPAGDHKHGILQVPRAHLQPQKQHPGHMKHTTHALDEGERLKDRNLRMMKSTVQKRSKKGPKTGVQSHKTP
jgi:hypothetical protein